MGPPREEAIVNRRAQQALAIGTAALVLAGGAAGGALASARAPSAASLQHRHVGFGIVRAVSDYLGLTPRQLFQQVRSGKSLAEIATGQGKTVDGLKSTILDAVKARLDLVVARNRISGAQEQTFLDKVQARLDTFVNRHFGQPSP
jgi:hypothetical protein